MLCQPFFIINCNQKWSEKESNLQKDEDIENLHIMYGPEPIEMKEDTVNEKISIDEEYKEVFCKR